MQVVPKRSAGTRQLEIDKDLVGRIEFMDRGAVSEASRWTKRKIDFVRLKLKVVKRLILFKGRIERGGVWIQGIEDGEYRISGQGKKIVGGTHCRASKLLFPSECQWQQQQ